MKKRTYISIFFIIISIILILVSIFNNRILTIFNKYNISQIKNNTGTEANIDSREINTNKINSEDIHNKVATIQNRVKIKDLLSKGDNYFQNDQITQALIKYKEANIKSPNDYLVIEKIGDTLSLMKKFEEANIYYEKLINNTDFDINKYILTLLYSKDLEIKENREFIKIKLTENIKDPQKLFFYTNSLYCLEDFHLCKKKFDETIFDVNANIVSEELIEYKKSVQTYIDFGLVDIYYKNALIIGSFMKLKMFPISIILGNQILKEKNDYKAIIQIVAQSYFELGDYVNANIHLKKYFELSPEDSNAAYLIGILNLKLGEYILSNIYFNKALNLGYESLNVKRKLIYNYYILENYEKMYNTFDEMLKNEKGITLDDISPIINYAIENNNKEKAYIFTRDALKIFPNEVVLYSYMSKLELDRGFIENSIANTNSGLLIQPNNQLLNFYLGIAYIKENKLEESKIQLKKSLDLDKKSEIAKEINQELKKIDDGLYDVKKEETENINN